DVTIGADDNAAPGQDLTILTGVAVQATAGNITLTAGDNFTFPAGATVQASRNVLLRADFGNADPAVGAILVLDGTITNGGTAAVLGNADADTFVLNRKGSGPITFDGQGGGDSYTVQLGNLAGVVSVADSGASGNDNLLVGGTPGADTVTLTGAALTTPAETVNYSAMEFLNVQSLDGADVFNVRGTNAATVTLLDAGTGDDAFNVSSDAPLHDGNLN